MSTAGISSVLLLEAGNAFFSLFALVLLVCFAFCFFTSCPQSIAGDTAKPIKIKCLRFPKRTKGTLRCNFNCN